MKSAVLGLFTGVLLAASACAHGLLGWPPAKEILEGAQVDAQVIAALAVGWYFGSASMLAFAAIVLQQAVRRLKGRPVQPGPLWAISIMYVIFGTTAFIVRDFNPHFTLFIGTGVLVGLFNVTARGADVNPSSASSPASSP